ncbi:MAG: hypothetical protein Q8N99_07810 [Nanoarchaeota archaeon]|nr:hypothetical protein [Nanoarchaeota archaeon]
MPEYFRNQRFERMLRNRQPIVEEPTFTEDDALLPKKRIRAYERAVTQLGAPEPELDDRGALNALGYFSSGRMCCDEKMK